jgi:SAM-dependent methyltransferase
MSTGKTCSGGSAVTNSTIDFYNKNAQAYFESTVELDMSRLYAPFLERLRPGAKVLDAGCGSGRDSLFFKSQGFKVTAFDASEEMVRLASQLLGQPVLHMTFEDLNLPDEYDGIWACASLLHVERTQLPAVIAELAKYLKPGGVFYMSFKYGNEEYWKDGRYFNCLDEDHLLTILQNLPELTVEGMFITTDVRPDRKVERWLNAYVTKAQAAR